MAAAAAHTLTAQHTHTRTHHEPAESETKAFWPAAVHVIGKDIIWFHCVIWPTILMSAGLPLPES